MVAKANIICYYRHSGTQNGNVCTHQHPSYTQLLIQFWAHFQFECLKGFINLILNAFSCVTLENSFKLHKQDCTNVHQPIQMYDWMQFNV